LNIQKQTGKEDVNNISTYIIQETLSESAYFTLTKTSNYENHREERRKEKISNTSI